MKNGKRAAVLFLFILIAFLPALSAILIETEGWYAELYKPLWMPPDIVFGPVWTGLYFLIGLSGFFAWRRGAREERALVFSVYALQLLLNALWSPLFFWLQRPLWALGDLILLWFAVLLCIGAFSQRSALSAWLLMPYFTWLSFAGAVNAAIIVIN